MELGRGYSLYLSAGIRPGIGYYGDKVTVDIMTKYLGIVKLKGVLSLDNGNWELMGEALPVFSKVVSNVTAQVAWKLPVGRISPYLFLQYHYGYDEALRDCITVTGPSIGEDGIVPYDGADPAMPRHMLRFGIKLGME